MESNVFYFLLLAVIKGTFSFTIPVIGGQLPGIGNGIGEATGGILGVGGTGNGIDSITGVSSVVKAVDGLGQGIRNEFSTKLNQNTSGQGEEKRFNLLKGIENGIDGISGGGLGGLLGGEGTGNGKDSMTGVSSVVKAVGGLGQEIKNEVSTKLNQNTSGQGEEKRFNLLKGIENGIDGISGGGLEGLLGGEGTGNGKDSMTGVSSVVKAVGGLGQEIKNAVSTKLNQDTSGQGKEKRFNLLKGIENGIDGISGGLLGGEGTGNGKDSMTGVSSVVKAVGGLGQEIKNEVSTKLNQDTSEQGKEKRFNLLKGIENGIEGISEGGLGGLLGGGQSENGIGLIPDVNSVVKTVGGLGQGIEKAVAKQIINYAAKQGMKTVEQYKTRVLKTIEDFFGDLFGSKEKECEKNSLPKTTEKSLEVMQGVGNGLLTQAGDAIGLISGGVRGGKGQRENKNDGGNGNGSTSGGIDAKVSSWLNLRVADQV
ncbi:glycine-rich cell wall structural protein-like [Belonocnema kinseyi]|uniref:glycine-rich cell wall structural protein-like n=1 Tax=Belonocnema kinseyi TaxID=2817044 RepID=UPI00143D6C17|nr:glycine-rich cell wall structural protein-like [Belonocnema kinseyi]